MNFNLLWAGALFDELSRAGVREVVICPGSRSAPLAVAASRKLRTCVVLDERSGGFFALGAAKAAQRPVAVLCTSGSAGAHFYPAILEAEATGVPLIAITADRPPELHGFGAPQTLDQARLFGVHARFVELGVPDPALLKHLRATVAEAARKSGPLHINAPFREPLAPVDEALPEVDDAPASARYVSRCVPQLEEVARELWRRPRGVVFCGPRDAQDSLYDAARDLSRSLGYALLADAASQVRGEGAVSHADFILRSEPWAKALQPQAVVRMGGGSSSKVVQAFLEKAPYSVVIRERGEAIDPLHTSRVVIDAEAPAVCRALVEPQDGSQHGDAQDGAQERDGAQPSLAALFAEADRRVRSRLEGALSFGEPLAAREAARRSELLYVSSSMPIRDVDVFGGVPRGRVLANRGLNGIDGIVSSAAGAAFATGVATTVLVGDLALLHDLSGLVTASRLRIPLRVVCVNNDGGGIFHFLPIASHQDVFEPLFGTPHGIDLKGAATLAGASYLRATDIRTLLAAFESPHKLQLIEVRTDRRENLEQHRALQAVSLAALGDTP
ncbi:MAG TPA: 2-succinyl-5-enolpyruvyl-6-hydroxy-3-cyclohexene-1-carboxylic-acid synthase [Myxococcales bacterium]|jgi:2-succinyl-5-enolpyruvyl-6-hydroxy-3-cyclohexene-1-carboxylate synthase